MSECGCSLRGRYIDPKIYLTVINNKFRQGILHTLYQSTLSEPITKKDLSNRMKADYNSLIYQLNQQLPFFWEVRRTEKVRGAHSEYIAPKENNTIFIYLAPGAVIWSMDPLANIFGKLRTTGTRCRLCSISQMKKCIHELKRFGDCIPDKKDTRRQRHLLKTNCHEPYTPVDYMLTCTVSMELEHEECCMNFKSANCCFMDRVAKK